MNHHNEPLPNFFIVGACKAGTTSLYNYLKSVPSIYMSPIKEPYYFSPNCTLKTKIHERAKYLQLFHEVKEEAAIGEASVTYLWDPESPDLIYGDMPEARIIIMLRNPVERAFSHWNDFYTRRFRKLGSYHGFGGDEGETLSFHDAIKDEIEDKGSEKNWGNGHRLYVDAGYYADQVRRYLDTFGSARIKVIVFEDFIRDTYQGVLDVLRFLGVEDTVSSERVRSVTSNTYNFGGDSYQNFVRPREGFPWTLAYTRTGRWTARAIMPRSLRKRLRRSILSSKSKRQTIRDEDRKFLGGLYNDNVKRTAGILGRRLPWKLDLN